jgi:chromosome segregation ATPase
MNELANHGRWIVEFGFYLLLALNLAAFVKMFLPQKREVSFADAYAHRAELASVCSRVERLEDCFEELRDQIRDDRETLMLAGEERVQRLQERLESLRVEMRADRDESQKIRAQCDAQLHRRIDELVNGMHEKIESLHARIGEVPEKIARLTKI